MLVERERESKEAACVFEKSEISVTFTLGIILVELGKSKQSLGY